MKFNRDLLKKKWAAYTFAACSGVVLYLALTHLGLFWSALGKLWDVGKPVFMALVISYVLDPLVAFFAGHVFHRVGSERVRHRLSVLFSVLAVILFFTVLMVALVPQVVESVMTFAGNLNSYVGSMQRLMRDLNDIAARHDIDLSKFISSGDELLQAVTGWLPENLNKIVNVSYGVGTRVFGWLISFILAIYLMLDGQTLKGGFVRLVRALLPDQAYRNTATFWQRCNRILVSYIAFDLLDGILIGVINWFFMVLARMQYVAIISVVVGVTNLAPTFGPMVGALIGAFILVLVNPWHALWFLLFTLILQTVDGYIIKPRLFGGQLGVSSVWILIALILGGRLLGVPGILLAIPAAAIGDFIYHDYVITRLEKRKEGRPHAEESGGGPAAKENPPAEGAD